MRVCLTVLLGLISLVACAVAAAAPNEVGVVILHGKGGSPTGYVSELAAALEKKGYLVAAPIMPWARDRIYDASFEASLGEIDREVAGLRAKGAKLVAVAGHSLGANVALGYAASRSGVDAVITLAAAHSPESAAFARRLGAEVARARGLVADGRGKEKQRFSELNQGNAMSVTATAEVYLSWVDPDGPAVMPKSAAAFKAPTPLLVVNASGDRTGGGKDYVFDRAPPHPKSRYVVVSGDHFGAPTAATEEVAQWLALLLK